MPNRPTSTEHQGRWSLADRLRESCSKPRDWIEPAIGSPRIRDAAASLLRPRIIGAQRFILDDEVTSMAASIGALLDPLDEGKTRDGLDWDDPAMLLAAMPRCRAPFDTTWFEWPQRVRVRAAGGPVFQDCADRCGFLVERLPEHDARYRMTTVTIPGSGGLPKSTYIAPYSIVFDLTQEIHASEENDTILDAVRKVNGADIPIASLLTGSAMYHAVRAGDDDAERACLAISRRATLTWSPWTGPRIREALTGTLGSVNIPGGRRTDWREVALSAVANDVMETAGDLRFMLGILALLNSRGETVVRWSQGSGSSAGPMPRTGRRYLDHRLVTLVVPRERAVEALSRSFGYEPGRRRRHPVRGTWCYGRTGERAGNPSCAHEYDTSDPLRQACVKCAALRWWRPEHERGDASIGYVTHDYAVRAGGAKNVPGRPDKADPNEDPGRDSRS